MRIFTDASYQDKKGIAGVGIVIEKNGHIGKPISFWTKATSVNEAELYAIYMACILAGGKRCEIVTDSQTAIQYVNKGVADKPRTKEQYIRHKHCEFWAYKIKRFPNIELSKEKAHTGRYQQRSIGNAMADLMARNGIAKSLGR